MKKQLKYTPALVFCIFIFIIPILYLSITDSDYSPLEKRKLSQFPEPTLKSVFNGKFGEDFETYLNDQMPLRTFFVGTNAYYDQLSGRNGMSGIYNGKDDYLLVTPVEDKSTFDNNIRFIGEFIDEIPKPVYVCIVPSAGCIYNDKLPLNHYNYNDEALINKVKDGFSEYDNCTFIDIMSDFKTLSGSEQLYYKTDHHWTSLGAFECYNILGNYMGFTPTKQDQFNIESYSGFYGTNYSKSALWFNRGETLEVWDNKKRADQPVSVVISDGGEVTATDSLFNRNNLDTEDQYTVFLDGNHAMVTINNENAETDRKLLLLRDSYSHCLAPFLVDNYSEIILVDVRYYLNPVSDIVTSQNIDDILLLYSIDSIVNSTDLAGIY